MALLAGGAGWWDFHPHTLSGTASEADVPGQIGRAVYLDAGISARAVDSRTIDVRSVRPVVVANSAAASVGILVCHGDEGLGAVYDVSSFCTSVAAFRPGSIRLNGGRDQIILVVTPNARGTVRIAGVDVTYRDGIRRGDQRAGVTTVVNVP